MQVEGAVDELESSRAAIEESLHRAEKAIERKLADRQIDGREAELAGERASAGGLDIDDTVAEVLVGVERVGKGQLGQIRQRRGEDPGCRRLSVEQLAAKIGEGKIRLARDGVVGETHELLRVGFVADLGAADHDDEFGTDTLEDAHQFRGGRHVPDVHAEAQDARLAGQDGIGDVDGLLIDVELGQFGTRLQLAQVRHQVAQPKRGVKVPRVEGAQQDFRRCHGHRSGA